MNFPALPDTAPFSSVQRAWLSGFLAGMFSSADAPASTAPTVPPSASAPSVEEEQLPWHDPAMPMAERLKVAEGRPRRLRLMAAMAQLDCGSCGYLCDTYAQAIDSGAEKDIPRCAPGGAQTASMLKQILATAPAAGTAPPPVMRGSETAAMAGRHDRKHPFPARLLENR